MSNSKKKDAHNVAASELIEALRSVFGRVEDAEGYYPTLELAESSGLHVEKVRKLLRRAKKEGVLLTKKVERENIEGEPYVVTAFKVDLDLLG